MLIGPVPGLSLPVPGGPAPDGGRIARADDPVCTSSAPADDLRMRRPKEWCNENSERRADPALCNAEFVTLYNTGNTCGGLRYVARCKHIVSDGAGKCVAALPATACMD